MYSTISTIALHSVQRATYNTHSVQYSKELAIAFQPSLCDIHCSHHITSLLPLYYITLCTLNSWLFANCNYASMCSIMQSTKISITRYGVSLASELGIDTEQYCVIPAVAPVQYSIY